MALGQKECSYNTMLMAALATLLSFAQHSERCITEAKSFLGYPLDIYFLKSKHVIDWYFRT